MLKSDIIKSEKSYNKLIWPLYFVNGFNSIAFGGLIIIIVPLSSLFWPAEDYHALEMGILVTTLFWASSITGIVFGWIIDRYSRIKTLFIISLIRGISMIMLGFATVGQGLATWWYFFIFVLIFAFSSGGSYPAMISLSNDIVPQKDRSKFFGYLSIFGSIFMMSGFLLSGGLVEYGYWRFYFIVIGLAVLCAGLLFFFYVKEPKRGIQSKELQSVLTDDNIEYDFKLNREMIRKTMLSKTNITALVEGIFTNVFMGSLDMIILPYLQSVHNISPLVTGLFIIIFGGTGRVFGQILLARFSDKAALKNSIKRIHFIIIALVGGSVTFLLMFFIPLPFFSEEEGANIFIFFSYPAAILMGILIFFSDGISSLYMINQPPIIQEINLPEAQAQITSWNQFLEHIGYGLGPLIAGIAITLFGQDYQISATLIALFNIPGVIFWILSTKWYPKDKQEISEILKDRAVILNSRK
ncbi:MAG: MFS transporter [Candidatus Lokiarchaeota archaeon]|nr:MFS transporter [Candidatus Lokiarchaeota archaeon]